MADTGWIDPKIGTIDPAVGSGNSSFINTDKLLDPDLTEFTTVFLSNEDVSVGNRGQKSDFIWYGWGDPKGGYPSNAVITGIEIGIVADYTTENPPVTAMQVFLRYTRYQQIATLVNILTEDPIPDAEFLLEYSEDASPDESDLIIYGGPTEDFGLAGLSVADYLAGEFDQNFFSGNFRQGTFQYITGRIASPPLEVAIVRISTIRLKLYYEVPAAAIDIASDITFGASITPAADIFNLVSFDPGEAISFGLSIAPPTLEQDIAIHSDINLGTSISADLSDVLFIDNTADISFGISITPPTLVRIGSIGSADIDISVKPFADTIGYVYQMTSGIRWSVGITPPPVLGKVQTLSANFLTGFGINSEAPDSIVYLSSDLGLGVGLDADLGHDWGFDSDISFGFSMDAEIVKEQYLYSDVTFGVELDATLAQIADLYADVSVSVNISNAGLKYGPSQSDILSERRLVIEPKERTMVISPHDRTVNIKCPRG